MKIAILDADTLGDLDLSPLEKFGDVKIYNITNYEQTINRCKDIDIVVTNKVVFDRAILESLPNLKLIAIAATGMNNVDLNFAKQREVEVKNVAGYSTNSVVQTTFMLALALIGKLEYYNNYTKSREWSKSPIFTNLDKSFFEIAGKKWGIIGLGEIGSKVANIAKAFGAEVSYYATSGNPHSNLFEHKELKVLLESSDIISIHAPLNDKTLNLIDKNELALLKSGAIILNLGRGGIVNEKALANAIDNQNILAGLDVTNKEPIEADNPLMQIKKKENLIITPHLAWGSIEARKRLLDGIVKNIEEFTNNSKKV